MKKQIGFLRWTDAENKFTRKKNRIFAVIPESIPSKADVEPLFSSFNPKKVFKAPPSSKEALQRQLDKEIKEKKSLRVVPEPIHSELQTIDHQPVDMTKVSLLFQK